MSNTALSILGVALIAAGCGKVAPIEAPGPSSSADGSSFADTPSDAGVVDSASVLEASSDGGGLVYCDAKKGPTAVPPPETGVSDIQICRPGDVCGRVGTLFGWACCNPKDPDCIVPGS